MVLISLIARFTFVCKGCRAFEFDTFMQLTCIKIRGSRDFDGYPEEQVGRSWHRCVSPGIYANLSWIQHYLDVNGIYLALLASNLLYAFCNKLFRILKNAFSIIRMLHVHYVLCECNVYEKFFGWKNFYLNFEGTAS